QQFHQVFVDGRAGGLHEEHIAAADVLVDLAADFTVGEVVDGDVAQRDVQIIANPARKLRIGPTAEDLHLPHGGINPKAMGRTIVDTTSFYATGVPPRSGHAWFRDIRAQACAPTSPTRAIKPGGWAA